MKINKAFTDYYDWAEHLDQIPNDVVYVRTPMVQQNPLGERPGLLCYFIENRRSFRAVIDPTPEEKIVVSDTIYTVIKDDSGRKKIVKSSSDPEVLELSRKVGQPVFKIHNVIHSYNWATKRKDGELEYIIIVDRKIPILSEYGFPQEIGAEAIFGKIDYFVRNLKYDNPDVSVSTPMGNKEKIVSHGFDLRQSFRHRK
jgi:hypothetical protein